MMFFKPSQKPISINSSLPASLRVKAKTGFNRYELIINERQSLRTKSARALQIGTSYWGELSGDHDAIVIKTLIKKPAPYPIFADGFELFVGILQRQDEGWFLEQILSRLESAKSASEFTNASSALLALSEGVACIGYESASLSDIAKLSATLDLPELILAQLSKSTMIQISKKEIYICLDLLGPVGLNLKTGIISTPFAGVFALLKSASRQVELAPTQPIWQPKNSLMDGLV